jgi:hypothetical protein
MVPSFVAKFLGRRKSFRRDGFALQGLRNNGKAEFMPDNKT